jgi:hypothetical protein
VWSKARRSLELEMDDSTGLAKTAAVTIQGLAKGDYKLSYGTSSKQVSSGGTLTIEVPMRDARNIKIQKI